MELPCQPPRADVKRPDIPTPPGACDAHFHLFGPAVKFPFAPERAYTPPDAPLEALLAMHDRRMRRCAGKSWLRIPRGFMALGDKAREIY